jgi:carboxylesterase
MTKAPLDQVKPGCEPFAAEGHGPNASTGVVLIHGFTGSPDSTVPWAKHLNAQGYRVNAIRLPGHGTTWQDGNTKTFADLQGAAGEALAEMREHTDRVFLMAQSFGASLALRAAADHPEGVAGLVLVNPWVRADGVASWQKHLAPIQRFLPYVTKSLPGVASDIADPTKEELGYDKIPVALVASTLNTAFHELRERLPLVTAPIQLNLSAVDHVLSPNNAELIRSEVRSPIEEFALDRSYHVATLDFDAQAIFERSVLFATTHS